MMTHSLLYLFRAEVLVGMTEWHPMQLLAPDENYLFQVGGSTSRRWAEH